METIHLASFDMENTHGLSSKQAMEFKEAFDYFNSKSPSCNRLLVSQLDFHLQEMGYNATEIELAKFRFDVDPENTGQYDFDAFLRMVSKILRAGDDMEDDLKAVFRMFDEEGKGAISVTSFKNIFREVDPHMPEDELDELIRETDADGSGEIDFEEFKAMMTS